MGKFSDLPGDIMLDIFIRLPTESVVDCKSVSKTWRNVIHNPSFYQAHSNLLLNLHSAADSGKFRFIFMMADEEHSKRLYYLEYDVAVSSHRLRKLKLNPPFESQIYRIVGSCNGLVCIIGLPNHYTEDESSSASYVAYICNPITRECITLPELDRKTYYHLVDFMSYGFGYVASTNEYKVVRVYTFMRRNECEYAHIEVYTLGSDKGWRNVGKIKISRYSSISKQHAVFANGYLFWDFGKGKTRAFDLAGEVFVEFDEYWKKGLWIGILGGSLCSLRYTKDGKNSYVWLLKKKEDESFSWGNEFSLIDTDPYTTSIARTSSDTVLCYKDTKLFLYDLKSSSSKMLEDFGRFIYYRAIPHMNTLLSLKAFGEDNMETLEAGASKQKSKKSRKRKNR